MPKSGRPSVASKGPVLIGSGQRSFSGDQGMGSGPPTGKGQQGRDDGDGEELQAGKVLLPLGRLRDGQTPEVGERSDDGDDAPCKRPTPKGHQPDQEREVGKVRKPDPDRRQLLDRVQEPVLQMLDEGYEVQVSADASASWSKYGDDLALRRMEDAGAVITTVDQIISELAVDWTSPNVLKLRGILAYQ